MSAVFTVRENRDVERQALQAWSSKTLSKDSANRIRRLTRALAVCALVAASDCARATAAAEQVARVRRAACVCKQQCHPEP